MSPRGSRVPGAWTKIKADRRVTGTDDPWASDIVRTLLASCHDKQRAFVVDPGRRVNAVVGRGGGKTTGGLARAVKKLVTIERAKVVYIATTRQQGADLFWYPLKDLLEKLGVEAQFREVELRCTIRKTGSVLRIVGADNKAEIEKLRGQSFHEVIIDEAASYPRELLEALLYRVIGPRLGDLDGVITMIGTPGHILGGPFYDSTRRGSTLHRPWADRDDPIYARWLGWSSHRWRLEDGASQIPAMARLWREALIEKESNGWSDDNPIWMREYLGEWAADDTEAIFKYRAHLDGSPWNQWDPERVGAFLVAKLPEGPTDWIYGYGLDLGSKDPFALNVLALSPSDPKRKIHHIFGFERRNMYANEIAKLLIGVEAVESVMRNEGLPSSIGGLFGHTGWPAIIVADLAGLGQTLIDELSKVYGIKIAAADKRQKFGAIEIMNGRLIDGAIVILKDSPLESQMQTLQWKADEFGQRKEDKAQANHSTDSAIYVCTEFGRMFSSVTDAGPVVRVPDGAYSDPQGMTTEGEFGLLYSENYDSLY